MADMTFKTNLLPHVATGTQSTYSLGNTDKKWYLYGTFVNSTQIVNSTSETEGVQLVYDPTTQSLNFVFVP